MGAAKKLIDKKALRDLVPINALSPTHIDEISRKAVIEEMRANSYVFRIGDRDNQTVYLLEGEVEFLDAGRNIVDTLRAGSEQARHPLAHKQPRQVGARAKGKISVARVDTSLLDVLLTWDESAGYDVVEIDSQDDGDWMTRMLQSQAFLQLPPANIHQLLMRLEAVSASAGESIVRQGDEGDYFYIVKSGRLAVTRKASARAKEVLLAELGEGACFGEEALVSGTRRNASVMMITDGSLMRLSQNDFNELLRGPLVHELDYAAASELVAKGARWLDVRLPGEFENQSIVNSMNLPLSALRERCTELDDGVDYIVCCDTGRRSAAGAFVLSQRGFSVYTLKNGLMDVPAQALSAPAGEPAPAAERAAEVIPFESEPHAARSAATETPASAPAVEDADSELIDKLAAAESERENLQQEVARLEAKLRELQGQVGHLSGERDAQARSRDAELDEARRELSDSRQQLERGLQERDRQLHEAQQELERLRADYHQLGQRTSAVAGERDAMGRELQQARAELESLQQQHLSDSQERRAASERLQQALADQEKTLVAREQDAASLRQELETSQNAVRALERQLAQAEALAESVRAETAQLEARASGSEQAQAETSAELQTAVARSQSLEAALQSARAESEKLARQLEQSLEREQSLQTRLQEREQHDETRQGQWQQQLETANERIAKLEEELDATRLGAQTSAQHKLALEAQLSELAKEHQGALRDTRNALSRAQTETDNLKREHSRVMESLRQTERQLQQQRQDHEAELYRLRKELKEAAGASDAGLTAELEALEVKLQESLRLREELEVKLGERSAQLEEVRLGSGKLELQLQQAQESARQAEQQLLEANQAANEEMSVRLQAEERARQGLREELEATIEQRNQAQERLTVQQQEVEELRESVTAARQQLVAAASASEQDLAALREQYDQAQQRARQLEQERDAAAEREQSRQRELETAREQHQALQRTLDQLRAEAEVTRGLVDMQVGAGDESLHEQLQQAKQNVDVAVRLRSQAEEKATRLEAEISRLREMLQAVATSSKPVAVPSLDPDDPQGGTVVNPAEMSPVAGAETTAAEARPETVAPTQPASQDRRLATLGRLLGAVLVGASIAGGTTWWWLTQSLTRDGSTGRIPEAETPAVLPRDADSTPEGANESPATSGSASASASSAREQAPDLSERAARPVLAPEAAQSEAQERRPSSVLPEFVKGGAGLGEREVSAPAPVAAQTAPPAAQIPAAEQPAAPAKARPAQPLRVFSQPLAAGGRAPLLVEFRPDSFLMGSAASSANFDERPRHRVTLKAFAIGAREVTFAEYDRFARASGRALPRDNGWGRGERPVINVSWNDAVAYTRWLSQQTGSRYRLPSEAQWEFAARGGADSRFWWGNDVGEGHANCFDCASAWSARQTSPVGSFPANGFRLHDTAGNVMEWVQDCYQPDYSAAAADGRAAASGDCARRVVRGGAYDSPSANVRSASRDARGVDTRLDNLGFRVVKE